MAEIEEYTTKKVFELRKNKQLSDAYKIASHLFTNDPNDEWTQKAYAWVLIDIIKIESTKNLELAKNFFNQLNSINFVTHDDILTKQIELLKPKLDPGYSHIKQAEELSRDGKHQEALNIFQNIKQSGNLNINHHESYGWILYRYVKAFENTLTIDVLKKILFEYLNLKNERPSLLHSMILQIAIHYASTHKDFDIFKFFQIWNPKYLQSDDLQKLYHEGKEFPSLLSRLLKVIINNQIPYDINYLIHEIGNENLIIESIRETYFWKIFQAHKDNQINFMWSVLNYYVNTYSSYGPSHWHSEILKLAERYMVEDNQWRFYEFIKNWNIHNFTNDDWKEEINGEYTNKPLALKSLKKLFEIIKSSNKDQEDISWILNLYQYAIKKLDNNIWLLREYAILLDKVTKVDEAIEIYKNIILELSDQAYAWHEFANIFKNRNKLLSISMLCKAITIQPNEDFLGEIRLDLAELLLDNKQLNEGLIELTKYKKHREEKGWKAPERFQILFSKVSDIECSSLDNKTFYQSSKLEAEEYILSNIASTYVVLSEIFKNKEGKERLIFTDYNNVKFVTNRKKSQSLVNAKKNDVFEAKLHYDNANQKYLVLKIEKSLHTIDEIIDNVQEEIAIVDHINTQKKLFHYVINSRQDGVIHFDQTELKPNVGDFIKIKFYSSNDKKDAKSKINILKVEATQEVNTSLIKTTEGELKLKYKDDGLTYDYADIIDKQIDIDIRKPDFAFINDYYVPKYLLNKNNITSNINVEAKILFSGEKWNVYKIIPI
ncbi:tetratricopeptide repeat protein [Aliarcobacter butzleri]|uniref:tetratricopeptide repeat protein n=1 Tax=Aliarcobacter butzleri TaxID=28197 RepID=UPI00263C20EE|nr:hypothetical protein [Aliarcobacter butzleri]MDN5095808.1 hypothetical protein [Aliarcobacter butzleri]